jgi:hypothetical protein
MLERLWGIDPPEPVAPEPKSAPRNVLEPLSALRQRAYDRAIAAELAAENASCRAEMRPHMRDPVPVRRILTMPEKACPDFTKTELFTPHNINHKHPKLVKERARGRKKLFAVN